MTVELRVYDPDTPTVLLDTLDQAYGITWEDEVGETGSGRFTIPHDAPEIVATPTLLDRRNIVRVNRDGVDVFAWLMGPRSRQRGESYDPISVTGRGVISILDEHAVQPAGLPEVSGDGWDAGQLAADERIFGFQSFEFSGAAWNAPTSLGTQGDPNIELYVGVPGGWPDAQAEWLAPQPLDVNNHNPAGVWYARREWTWNTAYTARLHLACDDQATVWFDGEVVLETDRSMINFSKMHTVDLDISAGAHCIALRIVNLQGNPTWRFNPSSFLLNISTVDEDGELGTSLVRSFGHSAPGTQWQVLPYPASPPGMTVGHILRLLLEDAQAVGSLQGVTLDFTDTADSAGAAWPEIEIGFLVGNDTLLVVVQRLQDLGYDFKMSPTLVLSAWVSRSVDRRATVAIDKDVVTDLEQDNDGEYANVVVARTDGGWVTWPDPPPASGRVDLFVSLGAIPTLEAAAAITSSISSSYDQEARTVTLAYTDVAGPQPYIAFHPGDIITAPALPTIVGTWTATPQRVLSVLGTVTGAGHVDWSLELEQL